MYRLLSESCSGGPCPTLYLDDTGDVVVQGYQPATPMATPPGEETVTIPADAWARLLAGLPVGMLLRALLRLSRTPAREPQRQGR